MGRYRVSVDIGGTFTDFIFYDGETKTYKEGKTLTTYENLSNAIIAGLDMEIANYSDIDFFVHGTTVGLNAFLERRGSKVAIVTTEGFRDIYEIARGDRPEMYDRFYKKPEPLVKRKDVFEIKERILFDGSVSTPLDEESVKETAQKIAKGAYDSVVICLINAYVNPDHEVRTAELFGKILRSTQITTSHSVAREWREYERISTATVNAYIAPIMRDYLTLLEERMLDKNYKRSIHIMQSNGGLMTSEVAKEKPIYTLMSGPVGGAIGKNSLFETLGYKDLIGIDMGGTSFDVSMLIDGKPDVSTETYLEGFPILSPMVNVYTIGAGGGSIVSIEGKGLRVGPKSAGSNPGPACYGNGGKEATVTDANLTLGRIDAENFLGGRMTLDTAAAQKAIQSIADQIGMDRTTTAEGICQIANANMAGIIRQITVRKGIDPRDFAIVAFGGAGPMHAVFIAEELGIKTIIVPQMPGAYSAWGMHQCDLRQDTVRTYRESIENADVDKIKELYDEMRGEISDLLLQQYISEDQIVYEKTVDMRYVGQDYTLNVEFKAGEITPETISGLKESYNEYHQQVYGHHNPNGAIEIVNIRLVGIGRIDRVQKTMLPEKSNVKAIPYKKAPVVFAGKNVETGIFMRNELCPGTRFEGPAVIEELSATTVVPPGYSIHVDGYENIIITKI